MKETLRRDRGAAKAAKDALDERQALLDQRIQQAMTDIPVKLASPAPPPV